MTERKRFAHTADRPFCIGRQGMDQIQAVEGIVRSEASQRMFAAFESKDLSIDERRREMMTVHARKP